MNPIGVLRLPDHIHVGRGARASLAPAVASLGERAIVVVDPVLATTPDFNACVDALESHGIHVSVHADVVPELPVQSIEAATETARAAAPQVVVGYGGGSALDLAKLVALSLAHPGPLAGFYGENNVPGPITPVVAVPTTAGTGSEVTPIAVVTDRDRDLKVGVSDPALVPRFAIVDPVLTLGVPASVTAHAGIDALVHAVESYTAGERAPDWTATLPVFVGRNRLGSLLALEAVRLIGSSLPRAVAEPGDIDAREAMAWGSLLAGMAFGSAGTHLSHALQYPIGALTGTPHGLGTGMMLPYVLQACRSSARTPLAEIAGALGIGVSGGDETAGAQAAIDRIGEIVAEIGLPRSLAEIGITADQLPAIAERAIGVGRLSGNATEPPTHDLVLGILRAAHAGERGADLTGTTERQ